MMRSWLYCPGNTPKMIMNASLYGADGVVLDLEDAVKPEEKQAARHLVARAFKDGIVAAATTAVRINGSDASAWRKDLALLLPAGVRMIRLPKVEDPEQIAALCTCLGELENENGLSPGTTTLQAILEAPLAVERAFAIAAGSERLTVLSFGAEDYCAALGIERGRDLRPLDYPRSRVAAAAAAFGLDACDTVWGFLNDPEGLKADAERAWSLGFSGKSVIHPDQIALVNEVFSPSPQQIAKAERILKEAAERGEGAFSLEGRMIDRPVILRAKKILEAASD